MNGILRVDIWSDIACPWCYIGQQRFKAGLARFKKNNPEVEVEVEGHSYELSPETPLNYEGNGVDFLVTHKGMPREQVEQMVAQMSQMAALEGLTLDFHNMKHANTQAAHRVLHLAKEQGRYDEVADRLFRAFFTEGLDVSDPEVLAEILEEVGMGPDEVRDAFEDDELGEAVDRDITRARMLGVNGVPFYLINQKYGISGAQQPEAFESAFEQVLVLAAEGDPGDDD